ncbi:MAG: alcohol dehydrogenase [Gammaproteobacteria bacterium]|nr:MAG: alcohol dehydrogenase [Gammaproteobacteria bacterium]RLA11792.1 MAG: alcohol dehydrogenase [Gammaproteobacteria bacterium]RLA15230.1 MAG: alcohol dehydrogenase [Gammaproteobacteria bacterium]
MKAVVAHELNRFSVEEVTIDPPKAGEVKVKMMATGVCHSDLSLINGTIPNPFPTVLGHEGAGIVEEIGEGVTHVAVGDHVVMSFVLNCGECFHCERAEPHLCIGGKPELGMQLDGTTRVKMDGNPIAVMSFLGNMAEYAVVPEACVVSVDKTVDFKAAALVGCGVMTGVGAAIKTADIRPGSTVAVVGCGGVGLSVIQGARIAGAGRIIAVDLSAEKMQMAMQMGATEIVEPGSNFVKELKGRTNGIGVDYCFEVIGIPKVIEQCIKATRRGGTTVLVGVGPMTERFSINALTLPLSGKTIKGSMYGDANFKVDFPMLLGLYQGGKLDLDHMITRTYGIDEAPQAFADLESGVNARGVIVY